MPRYLFNVRSSRRFYHDEEGGLFTSVDAAHVTAIMAARDMAAKDRLKGEIDRQKRIEVCDEAGRCIATVWLTSVMGL
jgi:hypothetical protein